MLCCQEEEDDDWNGRQIGWSDARVVMLHARTNDLELIVVATRKAYSHVSSGMELRA